MGSSGNHFITVEVTVDKPVEPVWKCWTTPEDIVRWNHASDDWHTPFAENDLRVGGKFLYRMEAKNGSFGFDFWGMYDEVIPFKRIAYTMGDGRKAEIDFLEESGITRVTESFEAESENSPELQRTGWQAILDNFKRVAEE